VVAGSELTFADRGIDELKGVLAEWRVYRLT
jgi:hypothetical protein